MCLLSKLTPPNRSAQARIGKSKMKCQPHERIAIVRHRPHADASVGGIQWYGYLLISSSPAPRLSCTPVQGTILIGNHA